MGMQMSPPIVMEGCPSIREIEEEINGLWDQASETQDPVPMNILEDEPSFVSIALLAEELGVHRSNVLKRAKKLGVWVDKMWAVDATGGKRQAMSVTDRDGAAVLRSWFRR